MLIQKNKKIKILFRWLKYNHYTISAIMGLLLERLPCEKFSIKIVETLKQIFEETHDNTSISVLAYSFCSPEFKKVSSEIKNIKSIFKNKIIIICGGPHSTAMPEDIINSGADNCFIGESEESLISFLTTLADANIPKEKIIFPIPLNNFDSYPPFAYQINFITPMEIQRGCLNFCGFCQTPRIFSGIKERSIEYIKRFAGYIKNNSRKEISFIISDALSYGMENKKVNLKKIEELFIALKDVGLKINFGSFPSEISPLTLIKCPESAILIKKHAQNTKILLGGQSGSNNVLKLMNRPHSAENTITSIKILQDAGFMPIVDILFGFPGETKEDRFETLNMIKIITKNHSARVNLHYFIPLPGTPFANKKPEILEDELKEELFLIIKNGYGRGDIFKQITFS
ncbi:radical SAM domain-containing protein [Candidatus Omnitrophus magneticus]|uniref:Radical SAM domain-containing protein n=1 Tax=Candidatus Omnitrophus magneticus TaxID=1609969 RepID=A0A0F0CNR4_9BACT|nr:radical SAM domain-containing protein [Candidatus Omnitrophus magneticus]